MRRHRVSPVLVAAGGVTVVLLLGGWSTGVSPARSTAPPVAPASMTLPAADPGATPAPPSPPPPPKSVPVRGRQLGGVDLNGYCRSVGYGGAKLLANNPYGWVCFNSGDDLMASVTVNDACQWQGNWGDVAVPPGNNDPNGWRCWSVG